MAAWRQAIELAIGEEDLAALGAIARSRSEPASRVARARMLLAYREDPSFGTGEPPLATTLNSENSKANRIETMKGPAESGQICSVGRRKVAKKIAKNKRCYANTLRPRSRMLLKGVRAVWGVTPPLGHLRRGGWGFIIPWVNLTVTGNGGRSQRAAGRKTASPPLPRTRKFCRSSSCWATTRFMDR